jgi:hypothetical protein
VQVSLVAARRAHPHPGDADADAGADYGGDELRASLREVLGEPRIDAVLGEAEVVLRVRERPLEVEEVDVGGQNGISS